MVDYKVPLYQLPQETWDAAKCEKMAKHLAKDGLGTPYPFKGYIGGSSSIPPAYGPIRYNGGCIREGQWYQGENRPLPKVADGYVIEWVTSWGYRIRKSTMRDAYSREQAKEQSP
jgi:hypothetical protein